MGTAVPESPPLRMQNAVRALRMTRGWTSDALAVYAGVTPRTVRLIEAGDHNPTAETMLRICAALGESLSGVFWSTDETDAA